MSFDAKKEKNFIRIDLTPSQQSKVLEQTGKQAEAIEFSAAELEERIAPAKAPW